MNKLFLKIFGFFLLTILLVGSALIFVTISSLPAPPERGWDPGQPSARFVRQGLIRNLHSLVDLYESGEPEAMLARKNRSVMMKNILIFDGAFNEISNISEIPQEAIRLAETLSKNRKPELHLPPFIGTRIKSSSGKTYICVFRADQLFRLRNQLGLFSRFRASAYENLTREMVLGLITVIFISGVLCFFLARHLTTPISRLRNVTRELSEGNLSARVGEDIGKRKDELADLARDFDLMADQIEKLLISQNRLIRDVSHELRSPLARLNVALELARVSDRGSSQAALDRIEKESFILNDMIEQLLTLSRIESGTIHSDRNTFDLGDLLAGIEEDASFESGNRNIKINLEKEEGVKITGHEQLLHSALENIIRNALAYSKNGSEVDITMKSILEAGPRKAEITVRDHGGGVPESELDKIFQPFYRLAPSRDRKTGGSGIGLAITARAVRLHNGTIKAVNHPEGGLAITVSLPLV